MTNQIVMDSVYKIYNNRADCEAYIAKWWSHVDSDTIAIRQIDQVFYVVGI